MQAPSCGAKCNTNIKSFSRKSGDDIPVRIANAIVRIQNPEAVNRAIVQIAQGQPGNRNRYLVLQVRNLLLFCFSQLISCQLHRGDSPSVRLPPAIHPACRSVKRRRRYTRPQCQRQSSQSETRGRKTRHSSESPGTAILAVRSYRNPYTVRCRILLYFRLSFPSVP